MTAQKGPPPGIVVGYEPYSEIRKIIGDDVVLSDIFTADRILACAKLIETARETFFEITEPELSFLERIVVTPVSKEEEYDKLNAGIAMHARNIKGQAEMLGYSLIGRICGHIDAYCGTAHHAQKLKSTLLVKMVETLRLAYRRKITDEGGVIGQKILASLHRHITEGIGGDS